MMRKHWMIRQVAHCKGGCTGWSRAWP